MEAKKQAKQSLKNTWIDADLHAVFARRAEEHGTTVQYEIDRALRHSLAIRRIPIVGTVGSEAKHQEVTV